MSSGHLFDHYLSRARGAPKEQKSRLGNSLLKQAQTAAAEWESRLEHFVPASADLIALPDGSWLLKLPFTLAKPFSSKGEVAFHHYDEEHEVQNPIARDHLTGLPMVRPTTWKGHLRFAARMTQGVVGREPEAMKRLFGETRGEEGGMEGRLRFFPTFFTGNVQPEVITPLSRATRTPARGPIYIEVVPEGAKGTFCLLYLPLPRGQHWSPAQIAEDLRAMAGALRAMFLEYGFSAKKTAGWGLVKDELGQEGHLWAKGEMWPQAESAGPGGEAFRRPEDEWVSKLMDASGKPLTQLFVGDKLRSRKEYQALSEQPVSSTKYMGFKNWYEAHGEAWRRRQAGAARANAMRERSFISITGLEALLRELAEALPREGANG